MKIKIYDKITRERYMLGELDKLINFIQIEYMDLTNKWEQSYNYSKINLKNNQVCDLKNNQLILDAIVNYREFINQNNIQLLMELKKFNNNNAKVNARTKTKNSIEFKIENYIKNHENGKVPINKCFNDLFGVRITCNEELLFEDVLNLINTKYNNLKCIRSLRNEYIATHIYFKKDNYAFQWELQVWNKKDEINNINSHAKYKQDYVKWENENNEKRR